MIYGYFGVPGAGKSLFTLRDLYDFWQKDATLAARKAGRDKSEWMSHARPVYISGVKELKVPGWNVLENPQEWHQCPPTSIIMIDECQDVFPPRANGSQVPLHVSEIATHRHKAMDLFIVSQHPSSIDKYVRVRLEKTVFIERQFGSRMVKFYEWPGVQEAPEKAKRSAFKRERLYPKEVFNWYKSAEEHTHQFKLPREATYFVIGLVVLPLAIFGLWLTIQKLGFKKEQDAEKIVTDARANSSPGDLAKPMRTDPAAQLREYVSRLQPRVEGFPHTARAYDNLTQPTIVPIPAGCVATAGRCSCYTQQATPIAMDDAQCRRIVAGGVFVDFVPDRQQRDRFQEARQLPATPPVQQDQRRPYPGFPEGDNYVGVSNPGPVLSYDRGGFAPGQPAGEVVAGPVVQQAQGIGRGRVIQ